MFEIIEMNGTRRNVIGVAATFAGAKAQVMAMAPGGVYMEDDADHAGCADAFVADSVCGRVIAIQPEGFKL